jgi:DNA polymerase epsilon subunit 1
LQPIAEKNKKNQNAMDTYVEVASANAGFDLFKDELEDSRRTGIADASDNIVDIREFDVPYHVRLTIDKSMMIIPSPRPQSG